MFKWCLSTLVSLLLISGCLAANPTSSSSEYLITEGGGFALKLKDRETVESCTYSIILRPATPLSQLLYLNVIFENPADPNNPLTGQAILEPGMENIVINSPEVRGIKKGVNYKVLVEVYDNENRVNKIGEHIQYLQSSMNIEEKVSL